MEEISLLERPSLAALYPVKKLFLLRITFFLLSSVSVPITIHAPSQLERDASWYSDDIYAVILSGYALIIATICITWEDTPSFFGLLIDCLHMIILFLLSACFIFRAISCKLLLLDLHFDFMCIINFLALITSISLIQIRVEALQRLKNGLYRNIKTTIDPDTEAAFFYKPNIFPTF